MTYSAPQVGRWTTSDPIRAGLNWYAYVNEDPIGHLDRYGLLGTRAWGAIVAAGGAIVAVPGGLIANAGIVTDDYELAKAGYGIAFVGVQATLGGVAAVITSRPAPLPSFLKGGTSIEVPEAVVEAGSGLMQSQSNLKSK